jgi:hypothetical protein
MSNRTLLSFETFEKYEDDGMKHELVRGEHVITPPATIGQSRVRQNFHDMLQPYVRDQQLGEFYVSAEFKLPRDTLLKPDASFIRKSQIERTDPDGYFEGACAGNRSGIRVRYRRPARSENGALLCPRGRGSLGRFSPNRRVRAHFPDGHSETLADGLRSALFPGWSAPLDSIFLRSL